MTTMEHSAPDPAAAGHDRSAIQVPEKRTPFTGQEKDTTQDFPWFTDTAGEWRYLFGGKATFDMLSEQSRLAGD
jgi:hypothetical protein